MQSYRLPDKLGDEISRLADLITQFQTDKISAAELKARRVPFGVYEQRQPDTYMVRIRCAGGALTPAQLLGVVELSRQYGGTRLHLTSRQELQIHDVAIAGIIPVIRGLRDIGLASRGGGGNTVRNIIAPEDAGINPDDEFDVYPYARALTTRLIAEDDSWTLPRKLKIAFSGSSADRGYATINDLGFIACHQNGEKGFRVYVAGGMGAKARVGHLLYDFVPVTEVYAIARAVKVLFWKNGNRKNKHAARLRFLWETLGRDEFVRRFTEEYQAVYASQAAPLQIDEQENTATELDLAAAAPGDQAAYELWRSRYVVAQSQAGLKAVIIPVELGFIEAVKAQKLATFLAQFGENTLRLSKDQNFLLRNIPETHLANVYNFLADELQDCNQPRIFATISSCAGASTCQLGICLSRGLALEIMTALRESKLDLDALAGIKINISGCPNACGQHPAADLGFFGKAARHDVRMYPAYNVVAGACLGHGRTEFARHAGEVSARTLPRWLIDFLGRYLAANSAEGEFASYLQGSGRADLAALCETWSEVPDFAQDKNYYYDWGGEELFSLAGRGTGECSAGLFDLIDVDVHNIKNAMKKLAELPPTETSVRGTVLLELVYYAARMLLITRGLEPQTASEVYRGFDEHFIGTGLVPESFRPLLQLAELSDAVAVLEAEEQVLELARIVQELYANMDNAFQFSGATPAPAPTPEDTVSTDHPQLVKDFRGVACPMNFVKTKLALETLTSGDILEVILDAGEAIANVPGSVTEEGHQVVKVNPEGDTAFRVTIKKGES